LLSHVISNSFFFNNVDPCLYYNILSDAKRNQGHSWYTAQAEPYCDTGVSGDWKGNGWYRFVEPAGTQMADSDPSGKISADFS
jgi:hypothetical protein